LRPLPEPAAVAEIGPLLMRAPAEALAEVGAGRDPQVRAQRLREEQGQLLGLQSPTGLEAPHRLRLGEQGVAVAEGMEDLPVDARRRVAREIDDQRCDVVGVALGACRQLAGPLAGLLEAPAA